MNRRAFLGAIPAVAAVAALAPAVAIPALRPGGLPSVTVIDQSMLGTPAAVAASHAAIERALRLNTAGLARRVREIAAE